MTLLFYEMADRHFREAFSSSNDIVEFVVTESIFRKILELKGESMEVDNVKQNFDEMDIYTEEIQWIMHSKAAISLLDRQIVWKAIKVVHEVLKVSGPTIFNKKFFDELFNKSSFALLQTFSQIERSRYAICLMDYALYRASYT